MSSFTQSLSPLKWAIMSLVSVTAFSILSSSIVTLADNLEQAHNAFTTMLWSSQASIRMLENLSDFAANTPFEIPEIRQNAKQLLAMGVSAENIIPTLKALGDVASGTGANFTRLALNYGQVVTQGHLTGRELRDFAVNGVPILDALAESLGKTKVEVQWMISDGLVSANDVTKAFEMMTSEGWKFADLMDRQAKTFTGMVSNLKDKLSQVWERIGADLLDNLKWYVQEASDILEENEEDIVDSFWALYRSIQSIIDPLKEAIEEIASGWNMLFGLIEDGLSSMDQTNESTTTALAGNRSDLFYYLELGVGVISEGFKTWWNFIKETIRTVVSTWYKVGETLVSAFQWCVSGVYNRFLKLKTDVQNIFVDMVNGVLSSINWLWDKLNFVLPKKLEFWKLSLLNKKSTEEYKENLKSVFDTTKKLRSETKNTAAEGWVGMLQASVKGQEGFIAKLTDIYSKRVSDLSNQAKKEAKELNTAFTYWENKGWGGGWGSWSSKAQKEALKEVKEAYKDIEKQIGKHNQEIEEGQKQVEKLNKKYAELRDNVLKTFDEAKNAVKEFNKSIIENNEDKVKSLGERYVELKRKMLEIWEDALNVAKNLSRSEIEDKIKDNIYELNGVKPEKLLEYKDLLEEVALIEANTTEEQRKSKDFTEQKSKAQEILNKHLEKQTELEEKKAAALEKQMIADAFQKGKYVIAGRDANSELKARYEDEMWELVAINDFKNIQYAQDLYNKSEAIKKEREEVEKKISDEKLANEQLTAEKIRLDQYYTNVHAQEINKQKSKLDELIRKYHELAKAKASAGARGARAFGGEVKAGLPYLVGENFKPELFVPSTSGSVVPVNNYNQSRSYHFSGITINTNRAEDFRSEIQNHIGDYT